jgi:hypothetical protein
LPGRARAGCGAQWHRRRRPRMPALGDTPPWFVLRRATPNGR